MILFLVLLLLNILLRFFFWYGWIRVLGWRLILRLGFILLFWKLYFLRIGKLIFRYCFCIVLIEVFEILKEWMVFFLLLLFFLFKVVKILVLVFVCFCLLFWLFFCFRLVWWMLVVFLVLGMIKLVMVGV